MTAPAHEWLIAHAATDTARATGTYLPEDVIDQLDLITAGLRRMDDHLGGGNLHTLVAVHLRTVIDLLEHRRYRDTVGRRLHATAAELLRLGGFLAFDTGRHALAQRHWVAGLHAAHAAGDRGLGANILGFMSCQAKDLGQTREAVTLAETARAGYPATANRVQAILDLRVAEANAVAGDLTNTRRAIDTAFDLVTDTGHGAPDWAYWLDVTHAHGQAGYCYLRLGQWDSARTHLRAALAAQGATASREGALRQVLMATTYVRQPHPDIEQALDLGGRALTTLTGQVASARVTGHVIRLSEHLWPYRRNPAVKDFTDHARGLARTD
jgi:tetratricopeptide (TPR) repeat protein